MSGVQQPLNYAREHRPRSVQELQAFVRFPSISAQPERAADVKECAAWLTKHLRDIGLEHVSIVPTPRHPIVYADWLRAPDRPTLLIYGHYDVQPVDPLNEWQSPPFEPVVRDDCLLGRGASDDKGQMFTHVKALEAYLHTSGRLPVNVKCIFDGEEEIGSPNLPAFLKKHRRALRADSAVMSDMPIPAPDRPAITYGMRGELKLELEVRGPRADLHSGLFGGAVHNPLQALCEIVASLHDDTGRVTIPGFYRQVRRGRKPERQYLARTGPQEAELLQAAGEQRGWGEHDYTLYERTVLRPAVTLNGIVGGYQGTGSKAVIPSRAIAKLNFRIVPDQDPREIDRLFRQHVARVTPPTVRSAVRTFVLAKPIVFDPRLPMMRVAADAYRRGFGVAPMFVRVGGTIDAVNLFRDVLGIPTVMMGFALPDDHMHGPNEKFYLPNFYRGIDTCIWFLDRAGTLTARSPRAIETGVKTYDR